MKYELLDYLTVFGLVAVQAALIVRFVLAAFA